MFPLIDKMESNVFSNPDIAILNGGKFFEDLISSVMISESIPEEKTVFENINKLKDYNVISYEMSNRFHQAREARNKGIHDNPDKQAFRLCALLFQISVWFYDKYSGDSNFKKPSFNRALIVEKDKNANGNSDNSSFNKEDMRGILEDVIDEKMKDLFNNIDYNSPKSNNVVEKTPVNDSVEDLSNEIINEEENFEFYKTNGSYLITELSKLKISSKESIEDSEGFKDKFKRYMHVDREIQFQFKNKLEELSDKTSSQLILLAGSVGDGKSHLLSYMKSNYPELIGHFDIHNDATESFDPNLTAIETLKKILSPFSDANLDSSNKKLILAINLGILSDLMDDEVMNSDFSRLSVLLNELNIFDSSTSNINETSDFLTIINFTDYQLYELNEEGVTSEFISNLIKRVVNVSDDNNFYLAYQKDLELNIKSPVIYNYQMLMNSEVQNIVVQTILKSIIKNKKLVSTRNILNLIYEMLVPAEISSYSNMDNVHEYIDDLLPNLLFNSKNRSSLLEDISKESPVDVRSETIDNFIISLNTLDIQTVLEDYFADYEEFEFFREYLLSDNYLKLKDSKNDKPKQVKIKNDLVYYLFFFGKNDVKKVFVDRIYDDFLKNLYYYNYSPFKLSRLFAKLNKSMLSWAGSIKQEYILIDKLPSFSIGQRLSIDFQPFDKSVGSLKNNFSNSINFNVHADGNLCETCKYSSCNQQKCVKLNIDYLLFESITKINEGYQPNKHEKENLLIFDDFIQEILYKSNNKELLIYDSDSNKYFKFKKSSGYYYSLVGA